jgi:hypothetical protein
MDDFSIFCFVDIPEESIIPVHGEGSSGVWEDIAFFLVDLDGGDFLLSFSSDEEVTGWGDMDASGVLEVHRKGSREEFIPFPAYFEVRDSDFSLRIGNLGFEEDEDSGTTGKSGLSGFDFYVLIGS